MRNLYLLILTFLFVSGCSYTRYTPFIDSENLWQLSFYKIDGMSEDDVEELCGPPLMKVAISKQKRLWEYHYRHKNNLIELPPGFGNLFDHSYKEKVGQKNNIVFSSNTDHVINLIFHSRKLVEIRIDGKVITE